MDQISDQISIFDIEGFDQVHERLQEQISFLITRYKKNFTWDGQNRVEWFIYYRDEKGKEKSYAVQAMKDLTIVRDHFGELCGIYCKRGYFNGKAGMVYFNKDDKPLCVEIDEKTNTLIPVNDLRDFVPDSTAWGY